MHYNAIGGGEVGIAPIRWALHSGKNGRRGDEGPAIILSTGLVFSGRGGATEMA
jgi:hypothetical protein